MRFRGYTMKLTLKLAHRQIRGHFFSLYKGFAPTLNNAIKQNIGYTRNNLFTVRALMYPDNYKSKQILDIVSAKSLPKNTSTVRTITLTDIKQNSQRIIKQKTADLTFE